MIPCKARGLFREMKVVPIVGDHVEIRRSAEDGSGYIEDVLPRSSQLHRPPVANVDQALVVVTLKEPNINLNLLDRYLVMTEEQALPTVICFNKSDIQNEEKVRSLETIYKSIGYEVVVSSSVTSEGISRLLEILESKISVIVGPSGVGKATMLNAMNPSFSIDTGTVSAKTKRGRHTTRHIELFEVVKDSYVFDTPGFSSLDLDFIENPEDLRRYFIEFKAVQNKCRFPDCQHLNEPECAVKDFVQSGGIATSRYDNYRLIRQELEKNRRY